MTKKFLGLIICFLLYTSAFAQSPNYVEVTVNDTVLVQPDQFIYRLNFSPDMTRMLVDTAAAKSPNYYIKMAEDMREKQKQLNEQWTNKIINAGFTIMPQNLTEAFMKNNYEFNTIQIIINSIDSLKRFFTFIKNEKSLSGNLISAKAKSEDTFFNSLYTKLLYKARKRADYLAASIGKKVLDIISVTENRNYLSAWNIYSQNYIPPSSLTSFDGKTIATNYQIQSNLTVKFLIK